MNPTESSRAQSPARSLYLVERLAGYGMPTGLLLALVLYQLGLETLEAHQFQCVLLSAWLTLLSVLCCLVWALLRAKRSGRRSRVGWMTGPVVFLLILVGLYGIGQLLFWGLNRRAAPDILRDGPHMTRESMVDDPVLGYAPKANTDSSARLIVDGTLVYDYAYRTDGLGRRVVPSQVSPEANREHALLILGGSYAFSEGVGDDDSLANQLALRAPSVQMYNYAFSGYGPGQLLARFENSNLRDEVPEGHVKAVYLFIPNHVRRVAGAFSVMSWYRNSPYYRQRDDGTVFRAGSFDVERAGLTRWYEFLNGDQAIRYFSVDFPPRLRTPHYELTAAIMAAVAVKFETQFNSQDFYVVIYPSFPDHRSVGNRMAAEFAKAGLKVLDYSALFEPDMHGYFFLPHDPHPTPKAHRELAKELAKDVLPKQSN